MKQISIWQDIRKDKKIDHLGNLKERKESKKFLFALKNS